MRHHRVVHLVRRQQGLFLKPGNPKHIGSLKDLQRPGVRFINRQRGSGTRLLLDTLLALLLVSQAAALGDAIYPLYVLIGLRVLSTYQQMPTATIIPFRHPILMAYSVASMSWITRRKFDLGIGAGTFDHEFDVIGQSNAAAAGRTA